MGQAAWLVARGFPVRSVSRSRPFFVARSFRPRCLEGRPLCRPCRIPQPPAPCARQGVSPAMCPKQADTCRGPTVFCRITEPAPAPRRSATPAGAPACAGRAGTRLREGLCPDTHPVGASSPLERVYHRIRNPDARYPHASASAREPSEKVGTGLRTVRSSQPRSGGTTSVSSAFAVSIQP